MITASSILHAADLDHDGLDDAFEQKLLDRFQPTFLINPHDCDVAPAHFAPNEDRPRAIKPDGSIYGQAFPAPQEDGDIELHYYLLWSHDCGRKSHALDAEHVSALIKINGDSPKAVYWYAAAHQNTLCDNSQAAHAERVHAVDQGPKVWISAGKHASFLDPSFCPVGCGGDRCEHPIALLRKSIINVGELLAPLQGAVWTASADWGLAAKLTTDFSPGVLNILARTPLDRIADVSRVPLGYRRTILTSAMTGYALLRGAVAIDAAMGRIVAAGSYLATTTWRGIDWTIRDTHLSALHTKDPAQTASRRH